MNRQSAILRVRQIQTEMTQLLSELDDIGESLSSRWNAWELYGRGNLHLGLSTDEYVGSGCGDLNDLVGGIVQDGEIDPGPGWECSEKVDPYNSEPEECYEFEPFDDGDE